MKTLKKVFFGLIISFCLLILASCNNVVYNFKGKTFNQIEAPQKENLIGVLLIKDVAINLDVKDLPSGKFYPLFQANYKGTLPDGDYILVYSEDGLYPSIKMNGTYFAGVYNLTDEMVRINEINSAPICYVRAINFLDASVMSIICILIVFLILIVISLIVSLFKLKKPKASVNPVSDKIMKDVDLKDISDPDMLAAALVASIDYHEEVKEDVRIKSIKEVK